MPGSFYEVLGIEVDASPEDSETTTAAFYTSYSPILAVRRAYKKRALQTHPDRLPAGSTADDKRGAAEQFRKGTVSRYLFSTGSLKVDRCPSEQRL
jgi:DnaJ-class molecular chaperone